MRSCYIFIIIILFNFLRYLLPVTIGNSIFNSTELTTMHTCTVHTHHHQHWILGTLSKSSNWGLFWSISCILIDLYRLRIFLNGDGDEYKWSFPMYLSLGCPIFGYFLVNIFEEQCQIHFKIWGTLRTFSRSDWKMTKIGRQYCKN